MTLQQVRTDMFGILNVAFARSCLSQPELAVADCAGHMPATKRATCITT
jgi:hypothetical protein